MTSGAAATAPPPPKLLPAEVVLHRAISRCASLRERVDRTLPPSKLSDSCKSTLLRLVDAEHRFLSGLSRHHLSAPISTNVGYLESIVRVLQLPSVSKASRVCKTVPSSSPVHVDVVCTLGKRPAWVLVSDRNPKYVSWSGSRRNKGVRARVEQVVAAARGAESLKPDSVVLCFCSGLSEDVAGKLVNEFGASEVDTEALGFEDAGFEEVEDGWVRLNIERIRVFEINIGSESSEFGVREVETGCARELDFHKDDGLGSDNAFRALVSTIRQRPADGNMGGMINFDTTALIALVSGISNGGTKQLLDAPEVEMRKRFKGNYGFVMEQVRSELQNPILSELELVIAGKIGIVCESVHSEFKELIAMCGGPNEKSRADQLLNFLMIVPDRPSERMVGLPTTRKMAMKNKVVFGTGDYWHAPTLTANMGFVRAISQAGMSLLTVEHRPRALTGD